jgi:hypothetical protein
MVSPEVAKITARKGAWTPMTVTKIRSNASAVKGLLEGDKEFLKPLIQATLQEVLCLASAPVRQNSWVE